MSHRLFQLSEQQVTHQKDISGSCTLSVNRSALPELTAIKHRFIKHFPGWALWSKFDEAALCYALPMNPFAGILSK